MAKDATDTIELGVHLPLIDFGEGAPTLPRLLDTVRAAREHGFSTLAVHDHLTFPRPFLDGLTALSAVAHCTNDMTLFTSVALPVVRGPVALAKALGSLDHLSGGQLIAGVGPGSSEADYSAVGVPYAERWARFDEAVGALRQVLRPGSPDMAPAGQDADRYYDVGDLVVQPAPVPPQEVPLWIGSWGSAAGLRRVARLADGWLASAYNLAPGDFAATRAGLDEELRRRGRDPATFPDGVASMWLHITEDRADADRLLRDVLGPVLGRSPEELQGRVCVGSSKDCRERIAAYAAAGAQRLFLCPVLNPPRQLELLREAWPAG